MTRTDIAIIGGGLSGLAAAHALTTQGRQVGLLETRDRLGGRILGCGGYDLGPAWIWPHNRRMLGLADALGLAVFPQHASGRLVFEPASGAIRRDLDFSTMAGALRFAGGLPTLTDALAARLAPGVVRLGHAVTAVARDGDGLVLTGHAADGPFEIGARQVILALPPRLAADSIALPMEPAERDALAVIPTWMAGHAKLIAVYDRPFWRDAGLSGDAISHLGPLAEIHDASAMDGTQGALFGFVGVPAGTRPALALKAAALDQLARLFGKQAKGPLETWVQDWAEDPHTATPSDRAPLAAHPDYGPPAATARLDRMGLILAGSETAPEDGGFLEGALAAAERAVAQVQRASAASSLPSGNTGARISRSSLNLG